MTLPDRKKRFAMGLVVVTLAVVSVVYLVRRHTNSDGSIKVSGNIEVTQVELSFRVAGKILERRVDEGDPVKAGACVARLDDSELAQVAAQARAGLAVTRAEAERWSLEYARQKELHGKKVISNREFEIAEATWAMAQAKVKETEAALALAETRLGFAVLASPTHGVVLAKAVEPGEYVFPGAPVVTVANLEQVWMRAYVNETDLGRVHLGQKARLTVDALPTNRYEGVVTFIAPDSEFTPKNIQTTQERVKLVYRIKLELDNPNLDLKPGMPADAVIVTR